MKTAPTQIREWLDEEGRKRVWLASKIEVDQATLWRWLSDGAIPMREHRVKLADVTGLDVANEEAWL